MSFGNVGNNGVGRSSGWYDHMGAQVEGPSSVRVVVINKLSGYQVALWKDQNGNTVNDPALPKPTPAMKGITANRVGEAWIYGGETADGSRPRGL